MHLSILLYYITTKEKIVKALKNMNLSIEQIAQAVELTEKEVEKILKV